MADSKDLKLVYYSIIAIVAIVAIFMLIIVVREKAGSGWGTKNAAGGAFMMSSPSQGLCTRTSGTANSVSCQCVLGGKLTGSYCNCKNVGKPC